jgi:hypothetical protein
LPIDVKEEDIAKIQRGRALFKEWVCRRFCMALGIAPAGVGFREIEEISLSPGTRKVGQFHMDEMYFVQRDEQSAEEKIALHDLLVTPVDQAVSVEQMQLDLPANLRALVLFFRVVSWIVWPAIFFLTLLFRLYGRIQGNSFLKKLVHQNGLDPENQFLTDFFQLQTPAFRMEGRALINDRHGWRLAFPEGADAHFTGGTHCPFAFRVEELQVMYRCLSHSQLRDVMRLRPGMNILEDTKFLVNELPARELLFRIRQPRQKERFHCLYFIQGSQAIYEFSLMSVDPIPVQTATRIRSVIDSFELI